VIQLQQVFQPSLFSTSEQSQRKSEAAYAGTGDVQSMPGLHLRLIAEMLAKLVFKRNNIFYPDTNVFKNYDSWAISSADNSYFFNGKG
jgi:hypothetical protein